MIWLSLINTWWKQKQKEGIASKHWASFMNHKQNQLLVQPFLSKWSFYIQYDATIELFGYHLSTHDENKSKMGALQVNTRKLFMKHADKTILTKMVILHSIWCNNWSKNNSDPVSWMTPIMSKQSFVYITFIHHNIIGSFEAKIFSSFRVIL